MNTGNMYPYPQMNPMGMGPGFGMNMPGNVGMGQNMPMNMPQNMSMGYNNYQQLENRVNKLERQMRRLEMRINKLETPFQDNMSYQSSQGIDITDGSFSSMHMM
jgi:chaperonin cofactor prefoldin